MQNDNNFENEDRFIFENPKVSSRLWHLVATTTLLMGTFPHPFRDHEENTFSGSLWPRDNVANYIGFLGLYDFSGARAIKAKSSELLWERTSQWRNGVKSFFESMGGVKVYHSHWTLRFTFFNVRVHNKAKVLIYISQTCLMMYLAKNVGIYKTRSSCHSRSLSVANSEIRKK